MIVMESLPGPHIKNANKGKTSVSDNYLPELIGAPRWLYFIKVDTSNTKPIYGLYKRDKGFSLRFIRFIPKYLAELVIEHNS